MAIVELAAPMGGSVIEVLVATGDRVSAAQELIVLESMKMEIPVESPAAGTVIDIVVSAPQRIDEGDLLMRIEAD